MEAFTGRLQLTRTPQGIVSMGEFSARLPAECARCLKPFSAPVTIHLEELFVYPPQNATDPLLAVGEDAHLNLEPLLREYILLNQPTRPLCREDCRGLCTVCGADLNEEAEHHHAEEPAAAFSGRILLKTESKKESSPVAAAAEQPAAKAQPAQSGKKPPTKKKPPLKKPAAKPPHKPIKGGKKTTAAKKMPADGKKKKSTKK
ncbi:MAG: DUF177 domain-containing protein [Anaerolineales bacterium]|nr:DUF177 domain-containing protein [Anaerolineales bacterium]